MIRVVTGHDEKGDPVIIQQGAPPTVIHAGRYVTTELWVTDATPPRPAGGADLSTREWALEPPARGTCFRIVEIAPVSQHEGEPQTGQDDFQGAHQTQTLDYVTVLRGEVTLVVGGSKVTLRQGDSVVQQPGVAHDWQNHSSKPATLVGVLLSAQ